MSSLEWVLRSSEFLSKSKVREKVVYLTNTIVMGNAIDKFRKGRPCETQEKSRKDQHKVRHTETRKYRNNIARLILSILEGKGLVVTMGNTSAETFLIALCRKVDIHIRHIILCISTFVHKSLTMNAI